jgi:hypothetical protein
MSNLSIDIGVFTYHFLNISIGYVHDFLGLKTEHDVYSLNQIRVRRFGAFLGGLDPLTPGRVYSLCDC